MMIKFDAGDYIQPIFDEILAGTATEGGNRKFTVGLDEEAGAQFCDGASQDMIDMLDAHNAAIGAGEHNDKIFEILGIAYGG